MAGALLHVVSDEVRAQRFEARWERAADLAAALVGAGIAQVSAVFAESAQGPFTTGLFALVLPSAPALLAADLLAAIPRAPRRTLAPGPRLDAFLVSMRELGVFAALSGLLLAFAGWLLATAFAPGEGRPPAPPASYPRRLFAASAREGPRRLVAFLLGAAALSMLSRSLEVPEAIELFAAPAAALALALLAALSASAAAAVGAALLSLLLPWAPGPSLVVPALALGPLLFRRAAWRGGWKRRATSALLVLLLGACASMLLARPRFEERVQNAALSVPQLSAGPLGPALRALPVQTAAAALLLLVAASSLWRTGVRGWFAPLRGGERGA
jgi:hypothetical protein